MCNIYLSYLIHYKWKTFSPLVLIFMHIASFNTKDSHYKFYSFTTHLFNLYHFSWEFLITFSNHKLCSVAIYFINHYEKGFYLNCMFAHILETFQILPIYLIMALSPMVISLVDFSLILINYFDWGFSPNLSIFSFYLIWEHVISLEAPNFF